MGKMAVEKDDNGGLNFPKKANSMACKWMSLVGAIWIQAVNGTNCDFPAYSSEMKKVLGVSQVELNNLAVASDVGKVLGFLAGFASLHLPMWAVLYIAACFGFIGYGVQWLVISNLISPFPYWQMYLLSLIAGNSLCWFNTVCFMVCIHNFPQNKGLVLGLSTSYIGLSAAVYAAIVEAISYNNESLYLLLNAILPLIVCTIVAPFIEYSFSCNSVQDVQEDRERLLFIIFSVFAVAVGVYVMIFKFIAPTQPSSYKIYALAMLFLLVAPLSVPISLCVSKLEKKAEMGNLPICNPDHLSRKITIANTDGSEKPLPNEKMDTTEQVHLYQNVGGDHLSRKITIANTNGSEKPLPNEKLDTTEQVNLYQNVRGENLDITEANSILETKDITGFKNIFLLYPLPSLGDEHNLLQLLLSLDFWLYFFVYFCGGTLGLVFSNNLGQIAESVGYSKRSVFVSIYSASSFFGRLISGVPDYFGTVSRPGWICIWMLPMAAAFFLLFTANRSFLYVGTAILGMSTGIITSMSISVTSELFGVKKFGVNHNIVITNIPFGSLLFGYFSAKFYDRKARFHPCKETAQGCDIIVCRGANCYGTTFLIWGCVCLVGVVLGCLLWMRTRFLYRNNYK